MQAPGGPEEDPSGGFTYGGWTAPYFDDFMGSVMGKQMGVPFDLLLGRKTYDIFAAYWPHQKDPAADVLNKAKKYVVSNSNLELSWDESIQIRDDVAGQLRALKEQDGPMLQVHGSGALIQALLEHDLVDELWLKIFPVTLGRGKRLFGEGAIPAAFKLLESSVSPSGVIVANYKRDGEVRTSSMA